VDEERREFFRVMVRLPVRCLAVAADGSASLMMVRSVDLSAGGVCVVTDRTLRPGDGVRLAFEVADGRWLLVIGDVIGKGPHAAAVTALARHELPPGEDPGRLAFELNGIMLATDTNFAEHDDLAVLELARQIVRQRLGVS